MIANGIEYGYPVAGITTAYEVQYPFLVHTQAGAYTPATKLMLQKGDVVYGQKARLSAGQVLRVAESESSSAFIIPFKFTNGYMIQMLEHKNAQGRQKPYVYYDYKNNKKFIIQPTSIGITDISVIELKPRAKKSRSSIGINDISVIEKAQRKSGYASDTGMTVQVGQEWAKAAGKALVNISLLSVGVLLVIMGFLTFISEAKEFSKKV